MKFKVGDRVKVLSTANPDKKEYIGRFFTVDTIDEDWPFPYHITNNLTPMNFLWRDDELELAEFIKADLKNGMIVEYRDGQRRMVVNNDKVIGENKFCCLNNFNDKLNHEHSDDYTIDKVYNTKALYIEHIFNDDYLELLWERPKEERIREMTVAEIEKALGYKVKIKAED